MTIVFIGLTGTCTVYTDIHGFIKLHAMYHYLYTYVIMAVK